MKKYLLLIAIALLGFGSYAQIGNETQGTGAGVNITSGDYQTMYGDSAGYSITSGMYGVYVGYKAGKLFDTESDNIVIGPEAADQTNSGVDNIYIGKWVARTCTGTDNTVIGNEAAQNMTGSANDNTIIGEEAGEYLSDGDDNTFVGEDAGRGGWSSSSINSGSDNTFIGSASGHENSTGYRNCFVGSESGYDNTTGYRNTFLGDSAGIDCSIGHHNTFVGQAAGAATEYPSYNTFVGSRAGGDNGRTNNNNNSDGMRNTYLGYEAGYTNREGKDNVIIGCKADFGGVGYNTNNYNTIIGNYAGMKADNKSNNILLGYSSETNSNDAIAIGMGFQTQITGDYAMAFGYQDTITADSSAAFGYDNTISGANTFVFGNGITTSASNSVLLGGTNHMTVGIGTVDPNQNASLDLSETDKGFLISRMASAERTAFEGVLAASDKGMMVFDTDEDILYTWDGTMWNSSTNTDMQDLSLAGNTLSLSNDATTVDLSAYLDNTDAQDLTLISNTLSLTNDASTIDLSAYLDNTDTQLDETAVDAFVANNGYLTSFTEVDGDATNEIQDITLSGSDLTISSGSTIDLSVIDTDTDTQLDETAVDAFVANNGYLTSFTEMDGDATNEIQDITLSGSNLSISNGSTVDLSAVTTNTDEQDLTSATLVGTILEIEIENGNSVSVDLSPIVAAIEAQLIDHETRITTIEDCACDGSLDVPGVRNEAAEKAILFQNIPNPFNSTSVIKYYIPSYAKSANLVISNNMGQIIANNKLSENGAYGSEHINADGLATGVYYYTLYVNQNLVDTKKMLVK